MRRLAAVEVELKALEYTDLRTLAAVAAGKAPGPESSILKIKGTEVAQQLVLDLAEKLDDLAEDKDGAPVRLAAPGADNAVRALVSLGIAPADAERAVKESLAQTGNSTSDLAALIRASLARTQGK
jgi:Holliday junction resolvasome RuvABC DNA-binding subunit